MPFMIIKQVRNGENRSLYLLLNNNDWILNSDIKNNLNDIYWILSFEKAKKIEYSYNDDNISVYYQILHCLEILPNEFLADSSIIVSDLSLAKKYFYLQNAKIEKELYNQMYNSNAVKVEIKTF